MPDISTSPTSRVFLGSFPNHRLQRSWLYTGVDDVEGADDDVQRGIGPDRGGINAGVDELYASQLQLRQN